MKFKKYVLKNGLRVIINPLAETKAASVVVSVGAGLRYENKDINGISHFLEHMALKGTKKRPKATDIHSEIDSVGGLMNAATGIEETIYYIKLPSQHLDLALDLLSDILLNSKLEEKEIEKERGVIIEEINHYEDTPGEKIFENFMHLIFGDSSLGRPILGGKETLKKIKRKDFQNYLSLLYVPKNIVVSIAGDIKETEALKATEDYFGEIKGIKAFPWEKFRGERKVSAVSLGTKKTDQTHFCLGGRGYSLSDKRRSILRLLAIILGGPASSRLFTKIRDNLGLAYVVQTTVESFQDTGFLVTYVGANNEKVFKAIRAVKDEYRKICEKNVSGKELNKAKEFLKGNLILRLEDSLHLADFLGSQELLENQVRTQEEILKEIDQVTSQDILKVARDIFVPKNLHLAVIGPFKDKGKFDKILE